MSDHHRLLAEHPRWLQHREQEEKLSEAREAWQERRSAVRAEYEREKEEWRRARIEALRSGEEPPPEPQLEDASEEGRWFVTEQMRLREEGRAVLAEIADEIESQARRREAELLAEVRALLDALEPKRDELESLLATTNVVRAARDSAANLAPESRTRTRPKLSSVDLVDLVGRNRKPLDPLARR